METSVISNSSRPPLPSAYFLPVFSAPSPARLPTRCGRLYNAAHNRRWIIPSASTVSSPTSDLDLARQFAIDAARMLAATRCHNVVVLDVAGISPVTDFLLLATGTSAIQMKSACDEVQELGEPRGFRPLSRSSDGENWICIDLIDVVVHVFSHESRAFYDLDHLWGDGVAVPWREDD